MNDEKIYISEAVLEALYSASPQCTKEVIEYYYDYLIGDGVDLNKKYSDEFWVLHPFINREVQQQHKALYSDEPEK